MNRMRELVDRLNETAYQYYTLDAPTISDREWDAMYDELLRLEKERERNVKIHCLRVAARIQREIERNYVEMAMLEKSET